jgi:hypothetical protein
METARESVDRTNRSLLKMALTFCAILSAMLLGYLVWFGFYVVSGRGVTCQTNEIVRGMDKRVDNLYQVDSHKNVVYPAPPPAPKACS